MTINDFPTCDYKNCDSKIEKKSKKVNKSKSGLFDSLVNKRLEAIDKKNPSMNCVATIEEVDREKNKIKIHFDGWTNKYDYWTDTADLSLFPAGYMRYIEKCQITVPYGFHKPKGINNLLFSFIYHKSYKF